MEIQIKYSICHAYEINCLNSVVVWKFQYFSLIKFFVNSKMGNAYQWVLHHSKLFYFLVDIKVLHSRLSSKKQQVVIAVGSSFHSKIYSLRAYNYQNYIFWKLKVSLLFLLYSQKTDSFDGFVISPNTLQVSCNVLQF